MFPLSNYQPFIFNSTINHIIFTYFSNVSLIILHKYRNDIGSESKLDSKFFQIVSHRDFINMNLVSSFFSVFGACEGRRLIECSRDVLDFEIPACCFLI
jgi:hypothetical protein